MTTIILLALAGAVIAAVVGTFWYMPNTPMGKLHMKYLGFDKLSREEQDKKIAEATPHMWKLYVLQMLLSLLTSFAVVFVLVMSVQNGVPFKMAIAFPLMSWLCFVVPTVGSALLWGNCDRAIAWKKFFSDSFSILVTILLTALLTSFFV
jgi:hypothetical protein